MFSVMEASGEPFDSGGKEYVILKQEASRDAINA